MYPGRGIIDERPPLCRKDSRIKSDTIKIPGIAVDTQHSRDFLHTKVIIEIENCLFIRLEAHT